VKRRRNGEGRPQDAHPGSGRGARSANLTKVIVTVPAVRAPRGATPEAAAGRRRASCGRLVDVAAAAEPAA
jgi:hypothetical protein